MQEGRLPWNDDGDIISENINQGDLWRNAVTAKVSSLRSPPAEGHPQPATASLRSEGVPKPVALVDTRERQPFETARIPSQLVRAERRATLKTGDYTVEGMEDLLSLERKTLADAVACCVARRAQFIATCGRAGQVPLEGHHHRGHPRGHQERLRRGSR